MSDTIIYKKKIQCIGNFKYYTSVNGVQQKVAPAINKLAKAFSKYCSSTLGKKRTGQWVLHMGHNVEQTIWNKEKRENMKVQYRLLNVKWFGDQRHKLWISSPAVYLCRPLLPSPCPPFNFYNPSVWWPASGKLPSWTLVADVSPVQPPFLPGRQQCGQHFGWWTDDVLR